MASDEFGIGRVRPGDYSKFFLTSFFILLHADIVAASDTASGEVPVPVPARLLQAAACASTSFFLPRLGITTTGINNSSNSRSAARVNPLSKLALAICPSP